MEGKRAFSSAKSAPLMKARSVSSLKTKGDKASIDTGRSHLNKNSPSVLRASANTLPTSAGRSNGKDIRTKSIINSNEVIGDPPMDEAKLDGIDAAYNSHVAATAMQVLLKKSELRIRGDIDKQISTLQKRVNDNLDALEKTRSKLNAVYLLQEQNEILTHFSDASLSYSNEPVVTEGKSFQELLNEINLINNQLPCKNVSIPETTSELATFQDATSKLLHTLELISTKYGSDQTPISTTSADLLKIKSLQGVVDATKRSTDGVSLQASSSLMKEAIEKTAGLKLE